MGLMDILYSAARGAVRSSPVGGALAGAYASFAAPGRAGARPGAIQSRRRRRRGVPKSIMADVLALRPVLGQANATAVLHTLLKR